MSKKDTIPSELEDVAYKEDISAVHARIDKCYSSENYEKFQESVEKIISRYLKSVVGWGVFIWLITLIGSMLLQKFFNLF